MSKTEGDKDPIISLSENLKISKEFSIKSIKLL
jgi:hypothetical protein